MAKIDWSKALAEYLKDETESYASIARRYGVSLQAVKKRAGREEWQELRQRSIQKVNQRLPEITGEAVAMVDARQAQIGKMLQHIGLKAIIEKRLTPENFTQAKESIKDGAKIEREAVYAGAEDRKKAESSDFWNKIRERYSYNDGLEERRSRSEEVKKPKSPVIPPIQKPIQTTSNTPAVDPQLLAKVQEGLSRISERLDDVKRKLEMKKTESTSANDRLTGWL